MVALITGASSKTVKGMEKEFMNGDADRNTLVVGLIVMRLVTES